MSKIAMVSVLAMFCLTAGCTYWHKDGTSFNDCKKDLHDCYAEMQKYSCRTEPGGYEAAFVKDCMRQKGYCLVGESSLPKNVKREDPQESTFWVFAGVSGTVDK